MSPARGRVRRLVVPAATLITALASISFWGFASASSNRPTISAFQMRPPRVPSSGGDVAITATVAHATICRLSSTPLLPGLPVGIRCDSGSFRHVVRFQANLGGAKAYRFVLTAAVRGASTTATRRLVQSPYIPLLSWGAPKIVDANQSLDSVTCPETTWCMAADSQGNVVELDGSSWTTPAFVGAKYVSCSTKTFCAATTLGRDLLTFNGSVWSATSPTGPSGTTYWAVSCASAALCVALGNNGEAIDNSGTWSYEPRGAYSGIIDTVSCPTTSFCMAVGIDAHSAAYNGAKWTQAGRVVPPVGDTGATGAVSCVPSRWCMYVGNGSGINNGSELGYADAYSGSRWTGPVVIEPAGRPDVNGVSCLPNGYCVAVDGSGDARTHFLGAWSRLVKVDPESTQLWAVSCTSMTFCLTVGFGGKAIVGT
jgi:hypothetical protein